VNPCVRHPEREASTTCELCAAPCCAECARAYLGRTYCPACTARLQGIATGAPPPSPPRAASVPNGAPAPSLAAARVPGWRSALAFLALYVLLVQLVGGAALKLPLAIATATTQREPLRYLLRPEVLYDAGALGLPLWSMLMLVYCWGSLFLGISVAAVLAGTCERRSLRDLGLTGAFTARHWVVGTGLAVALVISVVGYGAGRGIYQVRENADLLGALAITAGGYLLVLPLAALEELAVRGYLLRALQRSSGTTGAVVGSAVLGVVLHLADPHLSRHPAALLGLFLGGLYLSAAALRSGSLHLPIAIHAGWSLVAGPILGLPLHGITPTASVLLARPLGEPLWSGGAYGLPASLLFCLLLPIHLGVLLALFPRRPGAPLPARAAA
jgi:membrane protease YdiL (CAAX protease family)